MKIDIVKPEMEMYSGNITSAKFPGTEGSFGILKNHAPLICTLQQGQIEIVEESGMGKTFDVNGGVVEVLDNKIIVLAE
jgi:F-type H+-transporting ATPase subunit epsilon